MYNAWQLGLRYIKYWTTASSGVGHGIHSPFVFDFITNVLNDKQDYYCYQPIEALRASLRADNSVLTVEDFGAGSRTAATKKRSVRQIASSALKPKKYGQLLFRMANYYQAKSILELGTSLGITSAYLASACKGQLIQTMEGAGEIANKAQQNFRSLGIANIAVTTGNFDDTLLPLLERIAAPQLVYIDGNHRLEPTVRYFNQLMPYIKGDAILVFDDIHWSAEMEQAWETIKADDRVLLTIDLFFIGLVVFRNDFKVKQHFTIRF